MSTVKAVVKAKSAAVKTPAHPFARLRKRFTTASGKEGDFFSLPALAKQYPNVARLPVSIRIVLESVLRNCDGKKVTAAHVEQLANWQPNAERIDEIPFRCRARRAAGFHWRAAVGRSGRDAQRRRKNGQGPEDDRAAGAGRSGGRPLGDDRSLRQECRRQKRARPQHAARVPAQQRALSIHEVGHAGLRHLRRRAPGLRHRAPGQPGVPRARGVPEDRQRNRADDLLPRFTRRH